MKTQSYTDQSPLATWAPLLLSISQSISSLHEGYPDQLLPVTLDIFNQKDVALASRRVIEHSGRIDNVIVSNVGCAVFGKWKAL